MALPLTKMRDFMIKKFILTALIFGLALPAYGQQIDTRFIKDKSVTAAKMNSGTATNGQVATANGIGGVTYTTVSGSSTNQYDCVVSATPIAGFSTQTTIGACITATSAGGEILVMKGTYSENVTLNKQLYIHGQGKASIVAGTWTNQSGCVQSTIRDMRITDNMTFNTGSNGNFVDGVFFASGKTFLNSGTGNLLTAIQE